jgi:hypothetical protein
MANISDVLSMCNILQELAEKNKRERRAGKKLAREIERESSLRERTRGKILLKITSGNGVGGK